MASVTEQLISSAVFNQQNGNIAEAESLYRQAVSREPNNVNALARLGALLLGTKRPEEAVTFLERAVNASPSAAGYANLAAALRASKRLQEAIAACRKAIELKPDHAIAHCTLGMCLQETGESVGAAAALKEAIRIKPDYANAISTLGSIVAYAGRSQDSVEILRGAVEQDPKLPAAHYNLALVLHGLGKLDEGIALHQKAIALQPQYGEAHYALSGMLREQGRVKEALDHAIKAISLLPDDENTRHTYLMYLSYDPTLSSEQVLSEHKNWARQYAGAAASVPFDTPRLPTRRLRVGYYSSVFRATVIGRYMAPILANHDHAGFQIFCYSGTQKTDWMTDRLRGHADAWREVGEMTDAELRAKVREDHIDILIDLNIHAARSRLLAWAGRAAPIQATYAAYPGTSGVDAIDYHISDPHLTPAGGPEEQAFSEKIARLPHSFWCYEAPVDCPPVGALPADAKGYVTFGSLNGMVKQSQAVLTWWSELLRAVPNARLALLLRGGPAGSPSFAKRLADAGIDPARVTLFDYAKTDVYMGYYNSIDIGLDPLPYGGHSTSLDALYMGVPVVTHPSRQPWGRAGLTFAMELGLPELVAKSPREFVEIAVGLAKDRERLRLLRAGLRSRMEASPIMDAAGFTRDLESLYRQMWETYCSQPAGASQ